MKTKITSMKSIFLILITSLFFSCGGNDDSENNLSPESFSLTAIVDTSTGVDLLPTFSWNASTDPNGDAITYDLILDTNPSPSTVIITDLNSTTFTLPSRLHLIKTYFWKVIAKDSNGGQTESETFSFTTRNLNLPVNPITNNANFSKRAGHATVIFNNKVWVVGGGDSGVLRNDVWNSDDGIFWTQVTSNADFSARMFHTLTVFQNKMWLIGGSDVNNVKNDIWNSSDGVTWTRVNSSIPFLERFGHTAIVFNNTFFVIGGSNLSGFLNDIWKSIDGFSWTLVTDSAPFSARRSHTTTFFKDKLWLTSGFSNIGEENDIWSSSDGETWIQESPNIIFSREAENLIVYDDKLWRIAGSGQNNIFYSEDGSDWKGLPIIASFSGRMYFTSAVLNDKLLLIGGFTGFENLNDVWALD